MASTLTRGLILPIHISVWVRVRKRCHTLLLPSPPRLLLVYLCDQPCEGFVFVGWKARRHHGRLLQFVLETGRLNFNSRGKGRETQTYTSGGQVLDRGATEAACTYYNN